MNPINRWRRTDVDLHDLWVKDGVYYTTLGIADLPTVEILNMATGERENHVIQSLNFAHYKRLRPEGP